MAERFSMSVYSRFERRVAGLGCSLAPGYLFLSGMVALSSGDSSSISRTNFYVDSDPGISIYLREIRDPSTNGDNGPILLVHGARVPGVASFDLQVPGGSLAEDLAKAGFIAYVMDVRGYGHSTRPTEMSDPPEQHTPLVRSNEAVRDIDAAIDSIRRHTGWERISLFGWATGGQWAGYYAALHSEKLSHLVIHNALYRVNTPQPLVGHGSDLEDPKHPGQLNPAVWTQIYADRIGD